MLQQLGAFSWENSAVLLDFGSGKPKMSGMTWYFGYSQTWLGIWGITTWTRPATQYFFQYPTQPNIEKPYPLGTAYEVLKHGLEILESQAGLRGAQLWQTREVWLSHHLRTSTTT